MMMQRLLVAGVCAGLLVPALGRADEASAKSGKTIEVFDSGKLTVPSDWKDVQPRVSIIQHEFAATDEAADKPARVTMMAAGGSVDANISRWKGQFSLANEEAFKQEKKEVAGHTVYIIDVAGTFSETMGGPFAGGRTVKRPDYAMAGGIIVNPEGGKFFIKMIGPEVVVKANRKAFVEMLEGLQKK